MRHLIAIAGLVWPLLVSAQTSLPSVPVGVGDSVRVFTRSGGGGELQGQVTRQTPDSLALRRGVDVGAADTAVALVDISRVDAKRRHHSVGSTIKGLGIGFFSGAFAGGLLALGSMQGCTGDTCGMAILAVPILGIVGGVTGLAVGGLRTTERWETVWGGGPMARSE